MATTTKAPSWSTLKEKLATLDRADLPALVQALYTASTDNQAFLHARFAVGDDVLQHYKGTIDRWLWPDVHKNQDTSVAKAKKAITDYRKAAGDREGLAELMVFYCERAAGFSQQFGLQDEGYFAALVRMFAHAVKAVRDLPDDCKPGLSERLDSVRRISHDLGYGVGDEMDRLLVA